jgi:uncharacterized protein YjbJ (UPF0337 family)
MKNSTKNRGKGKVREIKGSVDEKVGKLTKNPELEAEGKAEKTAGKVQQVVGKVGKALGG